MTKVQELQIAQSESREKLAALLDVAPGDRSDEQKATIAAVTMEIREREPELRSAIVAEGDDDRQVRESAAAGGLDPETRERIELRNRSSVGSFLLAALQGRVASGAEAEYASAFNCRPGHIPMDLWEADRPAPSPEVRAATPAPSTGTGVAVAPISPFIFAPSIAPRLGIDMPSVGSGGYSELTVTTAQPAAPKAKGAAADGDAGALTAVTANPRRVAARMTVTLEDVASIGAGNFEAALRQNVSAALSDAYDNQAINGDGQAPNVNGLINQLTAPADPTVAAGFPAYLAAYAGAIDGLWATMLSEVSMVANVDAYRLSATLFRANSADLSFAHYASAHTGGWWGNARMPATASTIAQAIIYRMGRPGLRTACHPTWGTIAIDDIYTDSASGQRHFTVHALVGDKVLLVQPAAYALAKFKVA